jgi:hypothetical protein
LLACVSTPASGARITFLPPQPAFWHRQNEIDDRPVPDASDQHDHGCKRLIRLPPSWQVEAEFDGPGDCWRICAAPMGAWAARPIRDDEPERGRSSLWRRDGDEDLAHREAPGLRRADRSERLRLSWRGAEDAAGRRRSCWTEEPRHDRADGTRCQSDRCCGRKPAAAAPAPR